MEGNQDERVDRCLAGDASAWEQLVDDLWPVVAGTVWKSLANMHDTHAIDDICQDVFVKLCADDCRVLRRFDPGRGTLARYVAIMARSTALDAARRRSRSPAVSMAEMPDIAAPAIDGQTADIEDWELAAALGTLTAREREVMDCLYRREMTSRETALELGMAEATVRIHKMSGMATLKRYFGVAEK